MPRKRKYTDQEFAKAVEDNKSIRGVLKQIGLQPAGGNYKEAHRRIALLKLDTSHFTGKGHLKGKRHDWAPKTPTSEILVENSSYGGSSHQLKLRLIKEGFLERRCYSCNLTEWRGDPIPIELEHINGNNIDNRIDNLSILCPNCHAQTSTYRGKNQKRKKKELICKTCSNNIYYGNKSGYCHSCYWKHI